MAWGAEVSAEYQLVTGVPQGSVIGPLLFYTYTTSLAPIIQAYGFSYHCYADDAQLYLSFQPDDPTVAARISGCLADISAWMKEHHLQLNLAKTELLVLPATPTLQHDFTIQLGSATNYPIKLSQKSWCNFRWPADFQKPHCKDCSIMPVCTSQHQKDQALPYTAGSATYCPAHVTPLFVSLHWLPVAACIKFKTLMFAYRTATGSAPAYFHSLLRIYIPSRSPAYFHSLLRIYIPSRSPAYFHSLLRIYIPSRSPAYFHSLLRIYIPSRSPAYFHSLLQIYIPSRSPAYFHSLLRIYIPSRSLRSTSERRLVVPSLSRTFSFAIPGWRKELPTPIRNAESLTIFKRHLKIHLFRHHLISPLKNTQKIPSLSFLNFALFPLSSHCLARICSEQCLEICITSTSCVCL